MVGLRRSLLLHRVSRHVSTARAFCERVRIRAQNRVVVRRPDDLHLHVRDGETLKAVVPFSAGVFRRSTIMPNTVPPITSITMAAEYKKRIVKSIDKNVCRSFTPLMTLYLTDQTTCELVEAAVESEDVVAFKLYPAGATTNSDNGVTDVWKLLPVFKHMAKLGLLLLVHGEVTDPAVDVFDREKEFINRVLIPLLNQVPDLRVVLEHITTKESVDFVKQTDSNLAASITPQHLILNRNDLFKGGIRPHHYCLPVLKRELHRRAVLDAAISGNPKFFLGTDSAPHSRDAKESSCGCAGIFSAPVALSVYAEIFEKVIPSFDSSHSFLQEGALDKLEAFCSLNGARFYGLEPNEESIELIKEDWVVPQCYSYEGFSLVPFMAGETLSWKVKH